jgi:hypothetical protein
MTILNSSNDFFYSPLEEIGSYDYLPDPRDFICPYGADQQWVCGEIELEEYVDRYKKMTNKTNHVMRNMLNGKEYGNRIIK